MPDVQTAAVPVLDPATLRFPDRFTPQEVLDSLASAEAARDAAQDIADTLGGTPDGAVAALVDDPDSATRLALSSTYAALDDEIYCRAYVDPDDSGVLVLSAVDAMAAGSVTATVEVRV